VNVKTATDTHLIEWAFKYGVNLIASKFHLIKEQFQHWRIGYAALPNENKEFEDWTLGEAKKGKAPPKYVSGWRH
jgi:hypothetical protein